MAGKKRAAGEGSVRKRADGRWEGRLTVGITPEGKRIRKYFYGSLQREVVAKMEDAEAQLREHGAVPTAGVLLLSEFLDRWMKHGTETEGWAHGTVRFYGGAIETHIRPALGGLRLTNVTALHIDSLLAGKPGPTAKKIHSTMRAALNYAVSRGLLVVNPVLKVDTPKMRKKQMQPFDETEVGKLLGAVRERPAQLAPIAVMIGCGLRPGECFALRWSDVDTAKAQLRIERTLDETRLKLGQDEAVGSTKSEGSERTVPVPAFVLEALAAHKRAQGVVPIADAWIFTDRRGGLVRPSNFRRRAYRDLLTELEIPRRRLHDCRHTFATHLLGAGQDVRTVSELLGHADAGFTLRTYASALPSMKQAAADRLDALFGASEG